MGDYRTVGGVGTRSDASDELIADVHRKLSCRLYGNDSNNVSCGWDGYSPNGNYSTWRHEGIDFSSGRVPIYAVIGGTVAYYNSYTHMGIYNSEYDITIVYMHADFDSTVKTAGATVTAGQKIGTEAGNPNFAIHTHIEVHKGKAGGCFTSSNGTIEGFDPYEMWSAILAGNPYNGPTSGNGSTNTGGTATTGGGNSASDILSNLLATLQSLGSSGSAPDIVALDDFFANPYNGSWTKQQKSSDYISTLDSDDGLRITDLAGILGMPHQFLPTADARIRGGTGDASETSWRATHHAGTLSDFGRVYADKIIKNIPLLLMTPGIPEFMSVFSEDQKSTALGSLLNIITTDELETLVSKNSGKYYSLKYAYTQYFYYVNAMLRSAAFFLGIEKESIDNGQHTLGTYNWLYHTTTSTNDNGEDSGSNMFGSTNLKKFLGPYAGCIAFYADCGNQVDDSFGNSTTESSLVSKINGLSDTGRELNFLAGTAGSHLGMNLSKLVGGDAIENNIDSITGAIEGVIGSNHIIANIISKVSRIAAGGRMIFPEIWSDSSFSRSYGVKMKLVSPSGDKLSVYLNILVPIYHLLGFVLPRQSEGQVYYSPFLVRAYCKSLFNVDMGIITDLSITKGAEGEWTTDGLPTVAEVSFTIKDLYEGMFMSSANTEKDWTGIMSNVTELDYIANSCGVNINDHEIGRTIKMFLTLQMRDQFADAINIGIIGEIQQYFNQKIQNIFGYFN